MIETAQRGQAMESIEMTMMNETHSLRMWKWLRIKVFLNDQDCGLEGNDVALVDDLVVALMFWLFAVFEIILIV